MAAMSISQILRWKKMEEDGSKKAHNCANNKCSIEGEPLKHLWTGRMIKNGVSLNPLNST